MLLRTLTSLTTCALLGLSSLAAAQATVVNEQSITSPDAEWLSYGRDYQEQRFSPLDKVNRDNVDELDLAWSFKFETETDDGEFWANAIG